jgi:tripartite-type tricarboxylate transporter receptor subunit TctC
MTIILWIAGLFAALLLIAPAAPAEFAVHIKSETEKWARVIKTIGIKPE